MQRIERKKFIRSLVISFLGMTIIPWVFGCVEQSTGEKPPGIILTAVEVNKPPKIDGVSTDTSWKNAPVLKLKTKGGPIVTMRSVYTAKDIYITASWPDSTKSDIQRIWTFDGAEWASGKPDDSFAFVWNMDDSIIGFNRRGCSALCHETETGKGSRMEIIGPVDTEGKWAGRSQKADMWDLSLAISNVKGTVSDYVFALRGDAFEAPVTMRPVIERRDDKFEGEAPWRVNGIRDPETGAFRPFYRYKTGYNLESDPYPTYDQVEPITDSTAFLPGDTLPYMLFSRSSWTGSKADLTGKGVWQNGVWTIEISRALDTGQADDIVFRPASGAKYVFAVAVFNATIIGHAPSQPVALSFK